ncbi:MAG: prepilin peptidase [Candidatus Woesearchaeota archaeon]
MVSLIWYFLPGIIGLGIITSYEDIRYGKIRNKWVVAAIVLAIAAHILLRSPAMQVLANFLFACIIGFFLWFTRVWTAGDGKLFIAFAALLPIMDSSLYSLDLLINIFLLSLAIILIVAIPRMKLTRISRVLDGLRPSVLIRPAVCVFSLYWIVSLALKPLHAGPWMIGVLTLAILIFLKPARYGHVFKLMVAVCFLRLLFDRSVCTLPGILHFFLLLVAYRAIFAVSASSIWDSSQDINASKLKPGMSLAETVGVSRSSKSRFSKKPRGLFDFGGFINEESEGLTKEQIGRLRATGFKTFKISESVPFAPFMFLGALATLFFKGNVLIILLNL